MQKEEYDNTFDELCRDYILMRTTLSCMVKKCKERNEKLENVTEIKNIDEFMDEFKKRSDRINELQKESTMLKRKLNEYRKFGAVIEEERAPNEEKTQIHVNYLISEIEKSLNIKNDTKQTSSINQRIVAIKSKIQETISNDKMKMKEFDDDFLRIESEQKKIESLIQSQSSQSSKKNELQKALIKKNKELKVTILSKEKMQKQIDSLSKLNESLPENSNSDEMIHIVLQNLCTFSGNPTVDRFIKILQLKDDENSFPFLQQISISLGKIYRTLEIINKINQPQDLSLPFDIDDEQDLKDANVKFAYLLVNISNIIKLN